MIFRSRFYSFFFNDPATTEIYTLSLHDALPICAVPQPPARPPARAPSRAHLHHPQPRHRGQDVRDRKSTRLNSSHITISYAVFCLKKKKKLTFRTDQPAWIAANQEALERHIRQT